MTFYDSSSIYSIHRLRMSNLQICLLVTLLVGANLRSSSGRLGTSLARNAAYNFAKVVVCSMYITLAATRGTTETRISVVSVNSVMQKCTLIITFRIITELAYSNFVVAKVYRTKVCNIVECLAVYIVDLGSYMTGYGFTFSITFHSIYQCNIQLQIKDHSNVYVSTTSVISRVSSPIDDDIASR